MKPTTERMLIEAMKSPETFSSSKFSKALDACVYEKEKMKNEK